MAISCDVCGKGPNQRGGKGAMYAVAFAHIREGGISVTFELADQVIGYHRTMPTLICLGCLDKTGAFALAHRQEREAKEYDRKLQRRADEEAIDITPRQLGPGKRQMRLLGAGDAGKEAEA